MTRVIFRDSALDDIRSIKAYYSDIAPKSCQKVLDDIADTIERLSIFPHAGTPVGTIPHRRIVTPTYRYVSFTEILTNWSKLSASFAIKIENNNEIRS